MAADQISEFVEEQSGREVAPSTMKKYGRWIRRFEAWRPAQPDEDTLRGWDSYLADPERPQYPWSNARGPDPPAEYEYRSRVVSMSAVKMWLKHEFDTIIETEVQNIVEGEAGDFKPRTVEPDDVRRTIKFADVDCDNDDCEVAIRAGYDAIMRGAEIADARVEDVNPRENSLYVRAAKGSASGEIELDPDVFSALERHAAKKQGKEYLFHNAYGSEWTPSAWNQHFRRKHHDAGFHAFARHAAITNRLRNGEDFGDVYLRARHISPQTTLKYVNYVGGEAPGWVAESG